MSEYDSKNRIKEEQALNQQAIAADTVTNGEIIDTAGYESCTFVVQTGVVAAGDVSPLIEQGDDPGLSDAAAVTGDDLIGDVVALDAANTTTRIGTVGKKRYVRLSAVTANSADLTVGSVCILGNPHHTPTPA